MAGSFMEGITEASGLVVTHIGLSILRRNVCRSERRNHASKRRARDLWKLRTCSIPAHKSAGLDKCGGWRRSRCLEAWKLVVNEPQKNPSAWRTMTAAEAAPPWTSDACARTAGAAVLLCGRFISYSTASDHGKTKHLLKGEDYKKKKRTKIN